MMQMIKNIIFIIVLSLFNNYTIAQINSPFELTIAPIGGLSFTFFEMAKGYSKKIGTDKIKLPGNESANFGIGIQANWDNNWAVNISANSSEVGGIYSIGLGGAYYYSKAFNFMLNFEKKILETSPIAIKNKNYTYRLMALVGSGFYLTNDYKSSTSYNSTYKNFTITSHNDISGFVNIGFTNYILQNRKAKLTIGVLYAYGWRPIQEVQYKLPKQNNNQPDELIKLETGKHKLLFFASIPIALFRNNVQKYYIADY